jgi:RimJ/RimL family protein N-acetyltransferase
MQPLHPDRFSSLLPLFPDPPLNLVIASMAAGNAPASVWADCAGSPACAIVYDRSHHLLVSAPHGGPRRAAVAFARDTLLPELRDAGRNLVSLYTPSALPLEAAAEIAGAFRLERVRRQFLRLGRPRIPDWASRVPAGCRMRPIDATLLAETQRPRVAAIAAEIGQCWADVDRFLTHGFGFCLEHRAGPVSWCTAEYCSDSQCGLGINTAEPFQDRGFATLTAAAAVEEGARRRLAVHWDAWVNNAPSLAVAAKVGFEPVMPYEVTLIWLTPPHEGKAGSAAG